MATSKACYPLSKIKIVLLLFLLLISIFVLANARLVWSYCKPTFSFKSVATNAQVLYEPAEQGLAERVAASLPDAVKLVELEQYKKFKEPVFLYFCATTSAFNDFTLWDGATAVCTSPYRIFLSPVMATKGNKIDYVIHELSHAHLWQYAGNFNFRIRCPNWFKEGLATYLSHGAGAQLVTDKEARSFISSGYVFDPVENGFNSVSGEARRFESLKPWPKPIHMFYRQSMMFVAFLKQKDPVKFRQLLEKVEEGQDFHDCFIQAYLEEH